MKQAIVTIVLLVILLVLGACASIQSPATPQIDTATEPSSAIIEHTSDVPRITLDEAKALFDNGSAIFVDSRSQAAYDRSHIAGAIHVSTDQVATLGDTVATDQSIITYCT